MPKSPVFIVGSPRSGTSVLVAALLAAGYRGYLEGNFLPLMNVIDNAIDRFFSTFGNKNPKVLAGQVDAAALKIRIEDVFKEMTNELNQAPLWFDKSGNPEMIRAIPTLRRLWPEAAFIFAKRRAIENIVSRLKKFPMHDFEYHCADWARNMSVWREIRAELPTDTFLEVDQQDLIRDTEAISAKLSELLHLSVGQSATLAKTFKAARPQETTSGSAGQTYSLETVDWTETDLAIFKKHCESEMDAYGYGFGSDYYVTS